MKRGPFRVLLVLLVLSKYELGIEKDVAWKGVAHRIRKNLQIL